jgi:hypothetical protein
VALPVLRYRARLEPEKRGDLTKLARLELCDRLEQLEDASELISLLQMDTLPAVDMGGE